MTLNVMSSRYSLLILVLAGLIVVLGFVRVSRGFAKDASIHKIASLAALAAVAATLVRIGLFMADHNLALGSASSYGHLSAELGLYLMAGGVVTTFLSRLA